MMISRFFKAPPRVTVKKQHTGYGFYHPGRTNQTIALIFDFQVKEDFQSWCHSFWMQCRRIEMLHI